ncbi:MAG: Ferredoxin-dependent glutamate synthase 1 [Lentisphaerae bacterium ADurb.BinA184]|nr:MAG: Ferredoxin-dependent glutamate synthase 1 [Lentisphaerae bacterium ADurb.BinA184]
MAEDGRQQGLYDAQFEHDACGTGFVASLRGGPSHDIVAQGITILQNLVHRGASGDDGRTGDGAGILVQIPDAFLRRECAGLGIALPPAGGYGVGMFFLPVEPARREACRERLAGLAAAEGHPLLGWREVPVNPDALGAGARARQPHIVQAFFDGHGADSGRLERQLYLIRRQFERFAADAPGLRELAYAPSLSGRTLVYKGMMLGNQLAEFYADLANPAFVSAAAVIHQRYSTNTFPSWQLAQPFRLLAHNGEINTLRGNRNQMQAREALLASAGLGDDLRKVLPVFDGQGSDSACLDSALELLLRGGRDLPLALLMLIPQAWGVKYPIGPDLRGFFEYCSGIMEPWDGPAAVTFSDGRVVGALNDRNGLRPARYTLTRGGLVVVASEAGALPLDPAEVAEKGALRPGQMLLVDLESGRLLKDAEIKATCARRHPYRRWVAENKIVLRGLFGDLTPVTPDVSSLGFRQRLFGYTREDLQVILGPMASNGHEPVGSMGNDAPLAVLSDTPHLLYAYFRQLFAQVTNPPIDSIREELVMSLMTYIGRTPHIFSDEPRHAQLIKLPQPILANHDVERLKTLSLPAFTTTVLPLGFDPEGGAAGFEEAVERVCARAAEAACRQRAILVLSDRGLPEPMAPLPALLGVAAVTRRLQAEGLLPHASLVVETGEAREVHHMALLLGYGATAVNPYLAFESVAQMAAERTLERELGVTQAIENYIHALDKGLLKVMAKMGISTLRSYRGAQVFEAVGLARAVVDRYFAGTPSRLEGIGLAEISAEATARWRAARRDARRGVPVLPSGGQYRYRTDGERHLWTPQAISTLQLAVRRNDASLYREYARLINDQSRGLCTLRGLFEFKPSTPVPLDEVEPVEAIVRRFATGAMSFGSISREAHETLAIAMNRLGAMSNSGEGGEDPERYRPLPNGDNRSSAVKQVASGRFGVTIEYLVNARELQIKIAQGAKPGEGGQLPGHKVNREIAQVRHATPGVTLISPPPHHDIYSIEDIKQLIFDLKNANPDARVSVKLVSEVGVGTVAAGVAKAKADMVLISGGDGGTGAAPLSSIKHAGVPWELGLAETQQTLVRSNLRGRVRLQCDGQLKTGRDVVVAGLLGAEEFGFATAPLVVCGCVMMRRCHDNICPAGIATQNPELRRRFAGRPEHVIAFFRFVAEEVREIMAQLGFRRFDDLVGRSDRLDRNRAIDFWKARGLDFGDLFEPLASLPSPRRCCEAQDHEIDGVLDRRLIREAAPALESGRRVTIEAAIHTRDRAVGTMLSGQIARRYGLRGLPPDTITCRFQGAAGQSFGAFAARGLTLLLDGEANDYLGKGLSGGCLAVRPPPGSAFDPAANTIAGNVLLYGATSGEVYLNGRAGERFAVRNSGARAVVEGVGDHGCEYMTGGVVVVLGETGFNFAAGMSGGLAFVYDPDNSFDGRCNLDMVDLEPVREPDDTELLRQMIGRHAELTGSARAQALLADWHAALPCFVKVFPTEYRLALGKMSREDAAVERQGPVND